MEYMGFTAQGNRDVNEDAHILIERAGNYCFVVADGLGGHGKGREASQKVIEVFDQEFGAIRESSLGFLKRAFHIAQSKVMAMQQSAYEMKTTAVALAIIDNKLAWGHIGDSRLYHFRKGKLRHFTLDHSVAQMLMPGKTDAEIASHPDRNRLLRVIGEAWNEPRFELSKAMKAKKDDAFLLCSDGVWEFISKDRIGKLLEQSKTAEAWLKGIICEVERNGMNADMDNYTAITVRLSD